MPREQQDGHEEYKPLMRMEFDKLSRRRQVLELKKLGMAIENGEEAVKFFIKSNEHMYATHVEDKTPVLNPRTMTTADLLFHQHKIEDKIRRLYKRLRELRREASHCM